MPCTPRDTEFTKEAVEREMLLLAEPIHWAELDWRLRTAPEAPAIALYIAPEALPTARPQASPSARLKIWLPMVPDQTLQALELPDWTRP